MGSPKDNRRYWITAVVLVILLAECNGAQLRSPKPGVATLQTQDSYSPFPDVLPMERWPDPAMSRKSFFASAAALMALPTAGYADSTTMTTTQRISSRSSDNPPLLTTRSAEPSSLQESISGFVAGAALSTIKTVVKFPLDTATVRLQIPNSNYDIKDLNRLFSGSYNGVALSLLSGIPGGAVFFAVKDATKASLKASALATAPKWVTTSLAVSTALIPYWIVRNPSEVIKVRQQAGIDGYGNGVSAIEAIQTTLKESNGTTVDVIQELYTGYGENVAYGFPADVIKFVAYEAITDGRRNLSPLEGAGAGAVATAIAQLVTTPLDVIRNRLMTGKDQHGAPLSEESKQKNYVDSLVTLAREEGAKGMFAGASPRVAKAFLSGAIQFATYEETKQSIVRLLQR